MKAQGNESQDPGPLLPDNPAGNLLAFIESARAQNGDDSALNALRVVFGTLEFPDVIAHLSAVMQLPARIEAEIRGLGGIEHSLFLSWKAGVEKAFGELLPHLGNPWRVFLGQLDGADVKALQFCEHQLRRTGFDVRQRRLDELHDQIRQVLDDVVVDETIHIDLRRVILHHLQQVDGAITNFRFGGLESLQDALGAAVLGVGATGPSPADAKEGSSPSKVWKILAQVSILLTLVKGPLEIANEVKELTAPGMVVAPLPATPISSETAPVAPPRSVAD